MERIKEDIPARKQITFDLNQAALKHYYPKPRFSIDPLFYKKAYKNIAKFMLSNGFEHPQQSVYVSKEELTQYAINEIIIDMTAKMPWLGNVVSDITVTNVGEVYNLTGLVIELSGSGRNTELIAEPQHSPKTESLKSLIGKAETTEQERSNKPINLTRKNNEYVL